MTEVCIASAIVIRHYDMTEPSSVHVPVLLEQVVHWLDPQPGMVLVDGTARRRRPRPGAGRAASATRGLLIGIDRDPAAIDAAEQNLRGLPVRLVQANFCDLPEVLEQLEIQSVDGVVLDLGLSSDQLADRSRGFSFWADGPLDLRFDPLSGEPARRLVNRLSVEHLTELISKYRRGTISAGGSRQAIVRQRRERPIETSAELAELVRGAVPSTRARTADRPGHADLSGPADRGQRRIEIAGDRPAAHPRLLAHGGTDGSHQFSLAGGSAGEGGVSWPTSG